VGFSIQLGRAGDDATAVHYYRRRLAALAAIGLAHALLLRNGDILLPYALTGFLLIPFRHARDGVLIGAAAIALLIPDLVRFLWEASAIPLPERPEPANAPYLIENAVWVRYWFEIAPFTWPNNLALFLLGFFAGRRALLTKVAQNSRMLFSLLIGGVIAGIGLLPAQAPFAGKHRSAASTDIHRPGLHLSTAGAWRALMWRDCYCCCELHRALAGLTPLAAIGRLALTNYLLQAVIIVPLCLLFGWFDRFTPTTAFLLAAAIALFQLLFSPLWLQPVPIWTGRVAVALAYLWTRAPLRAKSDYAPV
jgi:uncharacterized protein